MTKIETPGGANPSGHEGDNKVIISEYNKTLNICQEENLPRVVAEYLPRKDRIVLMCPFSRQEHIHGPAPGSRIAHCGGGEYIIAVIVYHKKRSRGRAA